MARTPTSSRRLERAQGGPPILNVVGCGRAGAALARLWQEGGVFAVGGIVNRSPASAARAARLVGAGAPRAELAALGPAHALMFAVPDSAIEPTAAAAAHTLADTPEFAFHLSGALGSDALAPLAARGVRCASLHPVRSFADSAAAAAAFAGTWCAIEGDAGAVAELERATRAIGGRPFAVRSEEKTLYHAGCVFASNYAVALLEVAVRALEAAGVERTSATGILSALARGSADNVGRLGTTAALTGPIARGDDRRVAAQRERLEAWDPELARLYRALGRVTLALARTRGLLDEPALARLAAALELGRENR